MAEPRLIALADIETDGLIRRPRPARVAVIAASIAQDGQRSPIEVAPHRRDGERQIYRLTTGWVRLEALRALGRPMAEPRLIALADIETDGLIRRPRPARVAVIAASIAQDGQRSPIEVAPHRRDGERQIYRLTTGWVRLEALRALGRADASAIVRRAGVAERLTRQIDDNLIGDGCTVLDRARYLAARKAAYETEHPETTHGGDRRGTDQVAKSGNLKFSAWAASAYAASIRAIERSCTIGERLDSAAAEQLAPSEWAEHQAALEAISRLTVSLQRSVAALLTRDPDPVDGVAEAVAIATGAPPPPPLSDKHFTTAYGAYDRLGARQRVAFLEALVADNKLPTGWRLSRAEESVEQAA